MLWISAESEADIDDANPADKGAFQDSVKFSQLSLAKLLYTGDVSLGVTFTLKLVISDIINAEVAGQVLYDAPFGIP